MERAWRWSFCIDPKKCMDWTWWPAGPTSSRFRWSCSFSAGLSWCDPVHDLGPSALWDPVLDLGPSTWCDPVHDLGPSTWCDPVHDLGPSTWCDPVHDLGPSTLCDPVLDPVLGVIQYLIPKHEDWCITKSIYHIWEKYRISADTIAPEVPERGKVYPAFRWMST